jgi:serine-type D-Ala-D-Ala carboxypeptidase (penicillin-binding protein 5/6)
MRSTIFTVFITLVLMTAAHAKLLDVKVLSPTAIVMNADNGRVIYEKNAYNNAYPASITKIAVSLYVLEQKTSLLNEMCIASREALMPIDPQEKRNKAYTYPPHWLETDGSNFALCYNEKMSLEKLLYGMMLPSGNDAANVIAESVAGTIPAFMEELNNYIYEEIGCINTNFCNPHGLHHPDHVTTAYDMALITKRALTLPSFREMVSTTSFMRPKTNKQGKREYVQHNRLLQEGRYYYPYAIGVKTGYHSNAKNTLVAAAEKNDRTLIVVILGADNRVDRYIDAKKLFEKAFDEKKVVRTVFNTTQVFTKNVDQATMPIRAVLKNDLAYEYFPSEESKIKAFLQWDEFSLPIKKGDKIGEIRVIDEYNQHVTTSDIYSENDVDLKLLYKVKKIFSKLLMLSVCCF